MHTQNVNSNRAYKPCTIPQLEEGVLKILQKSESALTLGEIKIKLYKLLGGSDKLKSEEDLTRISFICQNTSVVLVHMANLGKVKLTDKRKVKLP